MHLLDVMWDTSWTGLNKRNGDSWEWSDGSGMRIVNWDSGKKTRKNLNL